MVDGKIYAVGGWVTLRRNKFEALSTVEMYDPATDTWTQKADMPSTRGGPAIAVVDGKIYVIGGWVHGVRDGVCTGKDLKMVEIYDPVTDTWAQGTSMPTARFNISGVAISAKIYAIGGELCRRDDTRRAVSTVEIYDSARDRWTKGIDLPAPRQSLSVSIIKGRIYAIGGTTSDPDWVHTNRVDEFDTGLAVNAVGKMSVLWGMLKVWDRFTTRR